MNDDDRMEYDDYLWDPDDLGRDWDREQRRRREPAPWRQPPSWDAPQPERPEPQRDPFTDTGPLDPYPPIGGASRTPGGWPPPGGGSREPEQFWRPEPEPPPPPPLPADDGTALNGQPNGHSGYSTFDHTDPGRYTDFTEALIERLAEGVADPHTDPRLPRQPPADPAERAGGRGDTTYGSPAEPAERPYDPRSGQGQGHGAEGPPIAARRQPPPPGAPPPPGPAADLGRQPHATPEAGTGPPRPAPASFASGQDHQDRDQPQEQRAAPPAGSPSPAASEPRVTIPSRASRHQARGWARMGVGVRLPKPKPATPHQPGAPAGAAALPFVGGRWGRRAAPSRPAAPPGSAPGTRRRPMAVPLPGELSGIARSSLALVGALVVLAAALVGVTSVLPKVRPAAAPPTLDPYSQRWVCPLLANQKATVAVANTGSATATLRTVTRIGAAQAALGAKASTSQLGAGQSTVLTASTGNQPGMIQVESFNAPVVASAAGQPACVPGPTDHAWLPIADLSAGAGTSVVIANPNADDAVVDLVPHLPSGIIAGATQEVFVQRRSTVTTKVAFGGKTNLAAGLRFSLEAVARSGRVVIGGVITQPGQPPTYVPGQSTPRASWSFAGGLSGNDQQTTLLVSNPTSDALQITARLIGDQGAFTLQDPNLVKPIPSGATAQIPIQPPTTASSATSSGAFGLQVSSRDGSRFIAALRVSSKLGSAQQIAYIDTGTALPDRSWLVPGTAAGGKVVLANPSGSAVTAQLIPVGARPAAGGGNGKAGSGAATAAAKSAVAPAATSLTLPPGRVVVRAVPPRAGALDVEASEPGVLVALFGSGGAIPSAVVGGVPAEGPVVQGPAA